MDDGDSDLWKDIPEDKKALLSDPALLYKVKCELDRTIKGEDQNKLLLWLVAASSYAKTTGEAWNLSAIVKGESSSGKSWLVKKVLQYFNNVEEYTRLTSASPDRLNQDFTNKILKVEELRGAEAAQATLRVWISEGKLRLLTTDRDEKGRIVTRVIETRGCPTFITTTTAVEIDNELLNRIFVLSIDESKEQTRDVLRFEAVMLRELGADNGFSPNKTFVDLPLYLQRVTHVLIPYIDILAEKFPIPSGRELSVGPRRDFKKFIFIIGVITWLHQMQRVIVQRGPYLFSVASVADFYMAWRICDKALQNTLFRLDERQISVLECFKTQDLRLTVKDIANETGYSENRAREILNSLVKKGYLSRDDAKTPYTYQLKQKPDTDVTIQDFVTALSSFEEKELKTWLTSRHYDTKSEPNGELKLVDPLTGEEYPLTGPHRIDRVPEKMLNLKNISLKQQKTLLNDTIQPIVPNLSPPQQSSYRAFYILKILEHPSMFPKEKCSLCGKPSIYAQINYIDGSWGLLCEECYRKKAGEIEGETQNDG